MESTTSGPGDRVRLPPTSGAPARWPSAMNASIRSSKSCRAEVRRQRQRQQGRARRRAHRREIAETDGQRLVTDRRGRRPGALEVHAVDEAVGGDDDELAAPRLDHGRIVADADGDPGRRRRRRAFGFVRGGRVRRIRDPRFAVWGGRLNLHSRWSHSEPRFRLPHHGGMHTTRRRGSLVVKHWLKRRSEPITHKAGRLRS